MPNASVMGGGTGFIVLKANVLKKPFFCAKIGVAVCCGSDLSFSNVPSSSLLYQMQNPVLSQNSILHLSPGLLKKTNKCPLNGSLSIKLSVSIESLLNPHRMSAGRVYMNIFTDDGSVSINPLRTKPKGHCLKSCCLLRNGFARYFPKKAQAPGEHDRSLASLPL